MGDKIEKDNGERSSNTDSCADFLQELETEFADRFTEKDEDYMKAFNNPYGTPPILDPWFGHSRDRRNRRPNHDHHPNDRDNRPHHRKPYSREDSNFYDRRRPY